MKTDYECYALRFFGLSTQKRRSHFPIKELGNKKWEKPHQNSRELLIDAQKEIEELNIKIMIIVEKLTKLQEVETENQKHNDKLAKLYVINAIYSDWEVKKLIRQY